MELVLFRIAKRIASLRTLTIIIIDLKSLVY